MKGIGRPSHKYLVRWSCDLLRRCAKVARSIWYPHDPKWWHRAVRHRIRPPARGEIWVIVDHRGESCIIVRCYTTSQLSKKQTQPLNNFSHIQKPSYNVRYCRGIVQSSRDVPGWRRATFIVPYLHMLWCARPSHDVVHGRATYYDIVYEIAQPSYDCNCVQMLTSASRQTII